MIARPIRAMLLDIEGTTTPISFVHDVLFPFSRLHLSHYLEEHNNSPEVVADLARLNDEREVEVKTGKQPPPLIQDYVYWLIDQDRKSPALKSLQGKIWEQGYKDGSLVSPVFADVFPAIKRWRSEGKTINIFSSGSVLAQQLLFSHTEAGDLTPFIDKYFDTTVGKKVEPTSYRRIAASLRLDEPEVHFISDVIPELHAASIAGMKVSLSVRPGNQVTDSETNYHRVESFDELF